jgi:hypothetical protein
VGYRGKVELQEKARALRTEGRTLADIAGVLRVAKSSVSLWVRDVEIEPIKRRPSHRSGENHPQHLAKLAEIDECNQLGVERVQMLSEEAFLVAGTALYAGEGSKTDGKVLFANTNAEMVAFFCAWLRRFFTIDEARLRARVYLHEGLDLGEAHRYWASVTGIALTRFQAPYRAKPDPSIRRTKHEHGCAYVYYCCSRTHREIMGLVRALLSSGALPG